MTNFISLNTLLTYIPRPLFEHSSEGDFLSWMLEGFRFLPSHIQMESRIKIFEFSDYKFKLPEDIKQINLVTYLANEPDEQECNSVTACIEDPEPETYVTRTENICRYSINYKLFLDSTYYNNNFLPLKYVGRMNHTLCDSCPNKYMTCMETFSIDGTRMMHLSLKEGFLCIDYDTEMCDDNGFPLVPDYPKLREYLTKYAQYKHWEERAAAKEEAANSMYNNLAATVEILRRAAIGDTHLRHTDLNTIHNIMTGTYYKLIKIPEKIIYARASKYL